MIKHPFGALYAPDSRVLILGSFPSVKSREENFFYGHPQNRFWKVTSMVFGEKLPETIPEKKAFLLRNKIALWDVIESCDITGSSDSSIKNVTVNDFSKILSSSQIEKIFVNGKTAERLYNKYALSNTEIPCICLPSTSPANAAWSVEKLFVEWSKIRF